MTTANTKKKPALSEITDEIIAGWKSTNTVFKWKATDGKVGYFKNPGIAEIEASSALATTGKPIQSNKVLAKACFLGGDECIIEEEKYLFGLGKKLQQLIVSVEGELEEL